MMKSKSNIKHQTFPKRMHFKKKKRKHKTCFFQQMSLNNLATNNKTFILIARRYFKKVAHCAQKTTSRLFLWFLLCIYYKGLAENMFWVWKDWKQILILFEYFWMLLKIRETKSFANNNKAFFILFPVELSKIYRKAFRLYLLQKAR